MSNTDDAYDRLVSDALKHAERYQQTLEAVFFAYYGFLYVPENPDCRALSQEPEFLVAVAKRFALIHGEEP